jgi:plastocyanin
MDPHGHPRSPLPPRGAFRALAVAAVCLALAGCSSGLKRPVREVTAVTGADSVQHVRVVAHSFWFDPNRIVVKAGIPVELTFKNDAFMVPHNFTCTAPEADVTVSQDVGLLLGSKKIRFTPTTPGEYHFYCHVDSHAKKGMTGTLVVVAP